MKIVEVNCLQCDKIKFSDCHEGILPLTSTLILCNAFFLSLIYFFLFQALIFLSLLITQSGLSLSFSLFQPLSGFAASFWLNIYFSLSFLLNLDSFFLTHSGTDTMNNFYALPYFDWWKILSIQSATNLYRTGPRTLSFSHTLKHFPFRIILIPFIHPIIFIGPLPV